MIAAAGDYAAKGNTVLRVATGEFVTPAGPGRLLPAECAAVAILMRSDGYVSRDTVAAALREHVGVPSKILASAQKVLYRGGSDLQLSDGQRNGWRLVPPRGNTVLGLASDRASWRRLGAFVAAGREKTGLRQI